MFLRQIRWLIHPQIFRFAKENFKKVIPYCNKIKVDFESAVWPGKMVLQVGLRYATSAPNHKEIIEANLWKSRHLYHPSEKVWLLCNTMKSIIFRSIWITLTWHKWYCSREQTHTQLLAFHTLPLLYMAAYPLRGKRGYSGEKELVWSTNLACCSGKEGVLNPPPSPFSWSLECDCKVSH